MDLFIEKPRLQFETKTASVEVDDDPGTWARTVLTQLYTVVPQIAEYLPEVMFLKTDEEQGFAYGVVTLSNATDSALTSIQAGRSPAKVVVPIIIKNRILSPLDIFLTKSGRFYPLNEVRLREALFRPETFDLVTSDFGDASLYQLFYPPGRSDNEFGAGIGQGPDGGATTMIQGNGMKFASAKFSMLETIAPSLLEPDLIRLGRIIDSDPALYAAIPENPAFLAGLQVLAASGSTKEAADTAIELLETALSTAPEHVIQMGYSASHDAYWVKTASRDAFMNRAPVLVSRGQFLKYAGPDVTKKVDTEGVVTVSVPKSNEGDALDTTSEEWGTIDEPGIYRVKTLGGKELTGWVIPNLVDFDGTRVPMAVFTNGAAGMVQDQIAGRRVGSGADLPSAPPKGTGVFYAAGANGVEATVPVMIVGAEAAMGGGDTYLVRTLLGGEHRVRFVAGLKAMKALGGDVMLPDSSKFLPLDDELATPLISDPAMTATKLAMDVPRVILFGGDGDEFGIRFHNLPKLASVTPARLDLESAAFALCAAGLDATTAHSKLAEASRGDTIEIRHGIGDVVLASDLVDGARKTASAQSHAVTSLRRYLIKEAAVLPNVLTVDAVLSLGFINSENVRVFISRIPYLEKALSQVCELLLASRLGLFEIPESATARCVRSLDEVVRGLKALALRDTDEDPAGA